MYLNKHILAQIRNLTHISMGSWDELCLLCGVYCGPCDLLSQYGVDDVAKGIAAEIRPGDQELVNIVKDALQASLAPAGHPILTYTPQWLPEGMGNGGYSRPIWMAVGCFNEHGESPIRGDLIPDARHVQVRRVRDGDGGDFGELLVTRDGKEVEEHTYTVCSAKREEGVPNFFLCERCYSYLENWLDWESLPPRSGSLPSEGEALTFASELYDLVNSRKARRDEQTGLLPEIDYDDIQSSLVQWQMHFIHCRRGSTHIAQAIEAGLRGQDLLPALLRDSRAWMFMRPDTWPEQPKIDRTPTFSQYSPTHDSAMPLIGTLPNELLLPILHDLPLPSLLALSATCRSLRTLITEPSFLDRVLKEAITRGSLRWLLPLETLLDEKKRAYDAMRLWLPEEHRPELSSSVPAGSDDMDIDDIDDADDRACKSAPPPTSPSVIPLMMSPHLNRLAFVRECWDSDSMMNRKRLWGQVKRFEKLWEDYRLHGWQVNRFYSPDGPVGSGQKL